MYTFNIGFPPESNGITHIGCIAHVRRYFEKALDNDRNRAEWVLEKLQYLYGMESDMREADLTAENVLDLRERKAVPVLEEIKVWLDRELDLVRPKSSIGKAIAYALR